MHGSTHLNPSIGQAETLSSPTTSMVFISLREHADGYTEEQNQRVTFALNPQSHVLLLMGICTHTQTYMHINTHTHQFN